MAREQARKYHIVPIPLYTHFPLSIWCCCCCFFASYVFCAIFDLPFSFILRKQYPLLPDFKTSCARPLFRHWFSLRIPPNLFIYVYLLPDLIHCTSKTFQGDKTFHSMFPFISYTCTAKRQKVNRFFCVHGNNCTEKCSLRIWTNNFSGWCFLNEIAHIEMEWQQRQKTIQVCTKKSARSFVDNGTALLTAVGQCNLRYCHLCFEWKGSIGEFFGHFQQQHNSNHDNKFT